MHTIGEKRIRMLNPREIKKSEVEIRTVAEDKELALLRDSIAAGGVLQPLLVRKIKKGSYQLISGERRLKAALMAGLRRVPCVVHNVNETTAVLYSLTENLQCKNLSVFDEARILNILIRQRGMSHSQVAASLGVSQSQLLEKLQVLRLDNRLADRCSEANLTERHIKALLRIQKEGRAQVLDTVITDELSPKQTEEYIYRLLNPTVVKEKPPILEEKEKSVRKTAIGDERLFSNSIVKLVDTLKNGGVKATFKRTETEKYTEYKIRIKKETPKEHFQKGNPKKSEEFEMQVSCL